MAPPDGDRSGEELRRDRIHLAAGASVYFVWWLLVELLLPGSNNPLRGRLIVVGLFVAVLALTYASSWVARNIGALFFACACALTTHYVYLVRLNSGETTWWGGFLITAAAVAACFHTQRRLLAYSVFTCVLAIVEAILDRTLDSSIFPSGVATILLLSNMALRSRLGAEAAQIRALDAQRMRERAEEANRFKSMFLGLVSHELLTPIQSIQLNIEAMLRTPQAGMELRAQREKRIARALRRLKDLIESLLEYARIEAGRMNVRIEPFDVVALVSESVDDLQPQARAKGLNIGLRVDPDVPSIRSDAKLLRLVLVNLLTNAIKYTDTGGIDVEVGWDRDGHRLSVIDTGCGIAADDQQRIFESFTQLAPLERKHLQGIGLGLAIVKEMVAKLGARLELSSTVGRGSRFTVILPPASLDKAA